MPFNYDVSKSKTEQLEAEIERLRLFLSEIAAMGPADGEWDADTLEAATSLAKRGLNQQLTPCPVCGGTGKDKDAPEHGCPACQSQAR